MLQVCSTLSHVFKLPTFTSLPPYKGSQSITLILTVLTSVYKLHPKVTVSSSIGESQIKVAKKQA